MIIYLVRPISGCSFEQVINYYEETTEILNEVGNQTLHAMMGKHTFKDEDGNPKMGWFRASDYEDPVSTDRAIIGRDRWMTKKADIIYANFLDAERVSIGSVMELAWAFDYSKHVVLTMQKSTIHDHAFIKQCADVIFPSHQESLDYLIQLTRQ